MNLCSGDDNSPLFALVLESPGCCGEGPEDDHQHPEDGPQARGFPQRSLCQEAGKTAHLLPDVIVNYVRE
jgi:hypothetical protein